MSPSSSLNRFSKFLLTNCLSLFLLLCIHLFHLQNPYRFTLGEKLCKPLVLQIHLLLQCILLVILLIFQLLSEKVNVFVLNIPLLVLFPLIVLVLLFVVLLCLFHLYLFLRITKRLFKIIIGKRLWIRRCRLFLLEAHGIWYHYLRGFIQLHVDGFLLQSTVPMVLLSGIKHGWLPKGTHKHRVLTFLKLSSCCSAKLCLCTYICGSQ